MTSLPKIDRRTALKWMMAASATTLITRRLAAGTQSAPEGQGYGYDPDLQKVYSPGMVWPLTLTSAQKAAAAALSDTIIPADSKSPSASAVGIVDFIDEWVSAPYPEHVKDRAVILPGLAWIDREAQAKFGAPFAALSEAQREAICDPICDKTRAPETLKTQAVFFARYRDITAGGFYTTPQGRNDLGYVGNTPQASFEGPPPEVLRKAGLL